MTTRFNKQKARAAAKGLRADSRTSIIVAGPLMLVQSAQEWGLPVAIEGRDGMSAKGWLVLCADESRAEAYRERAIAALCAAFRDVRVYETSAVFAEAVNELWPSADNEAALHEARAIDGTPAGRVVTALNLVKD